MEFMIYSCIISLLLILLFFFLVGLSFVNFISFVFPFVTEFTMKLPWWVRFCISSSETMIKRCFSCSLSGIVWLLISYVCWRTWWPPPFFSDKLLEGSSVPILLLVAALENILRLEPLAVCLTLPIWGEKPVWCGLLVWELLSFYVSDCLSFIYDSQLLIFNLIKIWINRIYNYEMYKYFKNDWI